MPNITEANAAIADTSGLGAQILDEEAQAYDAQVDGAKPEEEPKQDVAEEPESSGEEEDKGQVETEGEEASDESAQSEEPAPEPETEPQPKEVNATLKIGNTEFASVDDALAEANRINGRNAQLAGDLTEAEDRISTLQDEVETSKEQLQKVIEINQQWQAWYEKTRTGLDPAPPTNQGQNVEEIVAKALDARDAKVSRAQAEANARAEYEQVRNASNYQDVRAIIYKIADAVNPLTGKEFTPLEAYEYACRVQGVENALVKKDATQTPPATPKPLPKSPVNPALKKQAARPASPSARPKATPKPQSDDVDEALDRAFPTYR